MMQEQNTEILIVGGGLGGIAAALAALQLGRRVILTEETDWIGGQLTSQAVPPDESLWIEQLGCTATYRAFREGVRAYYRQFYPLLDASRPGNGTQPRRGYGQSIVPRAESSGGSAGRNARPLPRQ